VWQRRWAEHDRSFQLLAVAQDAQGKARVEPVVQERNVEFPVLLDPSSMLAKELGFGIVPTGFFVDEAGLICYRHHDDFDVADPRVGWNLERFLAGQDTESPVQRAAMNPHGLELFAQGVGLASQGRTAEALDLWKQALQLDPENFLVRSQIWVAEHPEHFYPTVDRDWQSLQLLKEGYEGDLP